MAYFFLSAHTRSDHARSGVENDGARNVNCDFRKMSVHLDAFFNLANWMSVDISSACFSELNFASNSSAA